MDLELQGKQVLITGSSKGIELASAIALATEGAHIHLVSSNADTLASAAKYLKEQTGMTAQTYALDLSRQESRLERQENQGSLSILSVRLAAILVMII